MFPARINQSLEIRDDIRCAIIVSACSIINVLAGYSALMFNVGLVYGTLALFLTRILYRRLVTKKSAYAGNYHAVAGILLPLLTIGILFVIRSDAANFCVGMLLSIAFYSSLYLGMNKRPQ
jgi:hypothetical protein